MSQYPLLCTTASHLSSSIPTAVAALTFREFSTRCHVFSTKSPCSRTPRPRAPFLTVSHQHTPFISQPRPQHRFLSSQIVPFLVQSTGLLPIPIYTSPRSTIPTQNRAITQGLTYHWAKQAAKTVGWWSIRRIIINLVIDGLLLHAIWQETEEEKLEGQRQSYERERETLKMEQEHRREYGVWLGRMNGIEDWDERGLCGDDDREGEEQEREYL